MESFPTPPQTTQVETSAKAEGDGRAKWKVLLSVTFGTFMVILDSTAVNVAIPTLQKVFGTVGHPATVDQIDGILTGYILALGIVTPLAGYLAERFGIKRIYLVALGLFVAGSFLCSLAPSLLLLVVCRILQGLGGGMIGPLGIALLFGAFPEKERGLAFGLFGIPLVVAPASGPVLGGYFVQYLSWRYIFYINIPVGITGIILGYFWLREQRRGTEAALDLPGILLSTISFGTLLYAIERGASLGWTSVPILSLLSIGILALVAFLLVELRVKGPLLDLRLFLRRTFAFANIIGWVSSISLFGAEFLLPLYLQTLRSQTPLQTGLLLLPLALAAGVTTPIAGALYNRIGPRWLIAMGSLLLAFNTWEFAHLTLQTSFLELMGIVAIRGVALGLVLQTTLTVALTGLFPQQLPRASSLLNALRNVAQSFGVALLGTIVTNQVTAYQQAAFHDLNRPTSTLGQQFVHLMQQLVQQGLPQATAAKVAAGQIVGELFPRYFLQGLNDAYTVTFWLAVAALLLSFTLPRRAGVEKSQRGEDEREQAQQQQPVV
jgi:DHA2 family multidrug resistance protein